MPSVLVGDAGCTFNAVVLELRPSENLVVSQHWKTLAIGLNIPAPKIYDLQKMLTIDPNYMDCVIVDLLSSWRSRESEKATISALLEVMETTCGWNDLVAKLRKRFAASLNSTLYNELADNAKKYLLERNVLLLGRAETLGSISKLVGKVSAEKIFEANLNDQQLSNILKPGSLVPLAYDGIPEIPEYYIFRNLSSSYIIDPAIFQRVCPDIFVFEDIELLQLSEFARSNGIDKSQNQIQCLTVRFIRLEFPKDFDRICGLSSNTPVHHLRYEKGNLRWIRSKGSLSVLQEFISKKQDVLPENSFLKFDQAHEGIGFPGAQICICDAAGMGKSLLLATLANYCKAQAPKRFVLYLSLPEFMESFGNANLHISRDAILEHISEKLSTNVLGKKILFHLLLNENNLFDIFFDAFDEINFQDIDKARRILHEIKYSTKNIRMIVATRPHMKIMLEQVLGVLAYNIVPFGFSDQKDFLLKYWSKKHKIAVTKNLERFTESLLDSVKKNLQDPQLDIAGVPLQCTMLADIYAEDARNHAECTNLTFGISVQVNSIFHMYKHLMKIRFDKISKDLQKSQLKKMHISLAMEVLFPSWLTVSKHWALGYLSVDVDKLKIYKVGLVEPVITVADNSSEYRFIHRTYAEFLLAEFLYECLVHYNISTTVSPEADITEFLFKDILYSSQSDGDIVVGGIDCGFDELVMNLRQTLSNKSNVMDPNCWEKLAKSLNVNKDFILEVKTALKFSEDTGSPSVNPLRLVLNRWAEERRNLGTLGQLMELLENSDEDWTKTTDYIKAVYNRHTFRHPVLCYFLNGHLLDHSRNNMESISLHRFVSTYWLHHQLDSHFLYKVITTCIRHDFSYLVAALTNITLSDADRMQSYVTEPPWPDLLATAARYSNENVFRKCLRFISHLRCSPTLSIDDLKYTRKMFETTAWTPLHEAVRSGNYSIVHLLIFGLECCLLSKKYILHLCFQNSSMENEVSLEQKLNIIKLFLKRSPNLFNEKEPIDDRTPLLMNNVHYKFTECILNACEDDKYIYDLKLTTRENGETLAHRVLWHFTPEEFHSFVEIVLRRNDGHIFSIKNKTSLGTPIHDAMQYLDIQLQTLDLFHSKLLTNFNNPDWEGDTELFCAVIGGRSKQVLEKLVKLGADWKRQKKNKQSIIHVAAVSGNTEAILYFISLGLCVNSKDENNRTPLHVATMMGLSNVHNVVETLLSHGAKANALDKYKRKALWYALNRKDKWVVEQRTIDLLKKCQSENITTKCGFSQNVCTVV